MAVNETLKTILLLEAKYKDVPAASLNPDLILENELNGERSMLYEFNRQTERKELFKNDHQRMHKECSLKSPFSEYTIEAFIVSKSSPILDSFDDIKWMRADFFTEYVETETDYDSV